MSSEVVVSSAYLRVSEIANNRRTGKSGLLPVSAATWWKWVAEGKAPAPIKLSPGVTVWRYAEVKAFVEKMSGGAA